MKAEIFKIYNSEMTLPQQLFWNWGLKDHWELQLERIICFSEFRSDLVVQEVWSWIFRVLFIVVFTLRSRNFLGH